VANYDASSLVWDYLKTDAKAVEVRALLVGGAGNVFEVGDLTAGVLASAEDTRRDAEDWDKALAIAVQDAGEAPTGLRNVTNQFVIVRVFDRKRGIRNIRTVRLLLIELLRGLIAPLDGTVRGVLDLSFSGRTGFRHDLTYAVDYEAITFRARVLLQEED